MAKDMIINDECRTCKNNELFKFLELGPTPLANALLNENQIENEKWYPLDVYYCSNCGLVQLKDIVPPEVMFEEYPYITSMSKFMESHLKELASEVVHEFNLTENDLIVDIGGNDGTLSLAFKELGSKTLNIEPAKNISLISKKRGIDTINDFISNQTAKDVVKRYGKAKIVTGTNVFAHINDLEELLDSFKILLKKDGIFIFEVPSLIDLINVNAFDTIYHEHLSYFSLKPLQTIFDKANMHLFRVKRVDIHGGSIRVFVCNSPRETEDSVYELLRMEEQNELYSLAPFLEFSENVKNIRHELISLLDDLKRKGSKIVGYGAAAKGNTLLNYCKIGTNYLEYIIDNTPLKQGLYTPGTHIPIKSPDILLQKKPDYVLLLAWNWAEEIIKKEKKYIDIGGKFIIPIPKPHIV